MKRVATNQFSTVFVEGGPGVNGSPGSGNAPRGPRGQSSEQVAKTKGGQATSMKWLQKNPKTTFVAPTRRLPKNLRFDAWSKGQTKGMPKALQQHYKRMTMTTAELKKADKK